MCVLSTLHDEWTNRNGHNVGMGADYTGLGTYTTHKGSVNVHQVWEIQRFSVRLKLEVKSTCFKKIIIKKMTVGHNKCD